MNELIKPVSYYVCVKTSFSLREHGRRWMRKE